MVNAVCKMMCYMYLCYSIHMAHNSPDMTGEVDVITNAEVSTFLSSQDVSPERYHAIKTLAVPFGQVQRGDQGSTPPHLENYKLLQVSLEILVWP